jgi:hypothetical protein
VREDSVVEPAQPDSDGAAADACARTVLNGELEDELRRHAYDAHVSRCDLTLYAFHAAKVLAHLRSVAPELVAAAELDVIDGVVR